jgi:hypothetical protein
VNKISFSQIRQHFIGTLENSAEVMNGFGFISRLFSAFRRVYKKDPKCP